MFSPKSGILLLPTQLWPVLTVPSRDGAALHHAGDQQHGQKGCRVCFGVSHFDSSACFIHIYMRKVWVPLLNPSGDAVNADVVHEMLEVFLLPPNSAPLWPLPQHGKASLGQFGVFQVVLEGFSSILPH